jgi:hypothetical protein
MIYRATTLLIAFIMGVTGVCYLLGVAHFADSTRELGYPLYLMSLLGVAKLLGVAALLTPGFPRLKEWAYAGFVFNLLGAAWSHLAVGQYSHVPLAMLWLGVLLLSYVTFRRLGQSAAVFPGRRAPEPAGTVKAG